MIAAEDRRDRQRRAPAEQLDDGAADQGCEQGDEAESGQCARHHARARRWRVEVAHDRSAAGHGGGHRAALQRPPDDQRGDVRRCRGADAGERVEGEAAEQHWPAPEAIGERPAQQLADAKADDERRERQLRRGDARAELVAQGRQRRQIEIGGDRLNAEQQRQQDDDGGARHGPRGDVDAEHAPRVAGPAERSRHRPARAAAYAGPAAIYYKETRT